MVPVTVLVEGIVEDCLRQWSCAITEVKSNQPVTGPRDRTAPDWAVTGPLIVDLRAEKVSQERLYTLTVTCTDDFGNQADENITVIVP